MEQLQTQGISLPRLGLGTYRMQGDACRAAVESALALGYRHIDTAEMYGNEEAIGAAIAASKLTARYSRRADHFRAHLLVESPSRGPLQRFLAAWLAQVESLPGPTGLRWSIDVDPLEVD